MIPFESLSVVYSHSILAMALSCVISEIKRDTGRKSRFFIPHAFTRRPVRGGGSPSEYCHIPFGVEN